MLVRRFLDRLAQGQPAERAEIVESLVRVFLETPLEPEIRSAAVTAMTLLLDDPSPRVRRALAEGLADAAEAPRAIVLALAEEQADIAEIVLARSPVLSDTDLVDLAGGAGERQRKAIAQRPAVSIGLAAALAEVSGVEACQALVSNPGAEITLSTFRRVIERHRKDGALRNALLERDDLTLALRDELIGGLSEALGDLVTMRQWLSPERTDRLLGEAREHSVVELAATIERSQLRALIERLAAERRLSPSLIIRAACAGNAVFFEEALSVASTTPAWRVASLIHDHNEGGFAALYRRSRLPAAAERGFRAIAAALRDRRDEADHSGSPLSRRALVETVLARYQPQNVEGADPYLALINRMAADARREAARAETGGYFRAA